MALKAHIITEDRVRSVRPILRWIKEGAPRKRDREEAADILRAIEGVKEKKQVFLTSSQSNLLSFIYEEFPETTFVSTQLDLFSPTEDFLMRQKSERRIKTATYKPKEKNLPGTHAMKAKPKPKEVLTEEEQQERGRIGLSVLPDGVPTDITGVPLSERIVESQRKLAERDRKFGREPK